MKTLIPFLLCITFISNSFAQEDKITNAKITSLSYKANSIDEIKIIDWDSIKEVFEKNKKEEIIKLSFELDLKKSKNKFKSKITVGGETKNLDSLIVKAKKGIKSLIKISKKYQNN